MISQWRRIAHKEYNILQNIRVSTIFILVQHTQMSIFPLEKCSELELDSCFGVLWICLNWLSFLTHYL